MPPKRLQTRGARKAYMVKRRKRAAAAAAGEAESALINDGYDADDDASDSDNDADAEQVDISVAKAPHGLVTIPTPTPNESNFAQVLGDSLASLLHHRALTDSTLEKLVDHTRTSKQLHLHTHAQLASLVSKTDCMVQGLRSVAEALHVALPPLEVDAGPVPAPVLNNAELEEFQSDSGI